MKAISTLLNSVKEEKALILIHSLADLDALGSAFALHSFLRNSSIIASDMPTAKARKLLKFLNSEINVGGKLNCDVLFILDTNSYDMLGELADTVKKFKGKIFLLDHHSIHPDSIRADHLLVDNRYLSTSELVYELLKELKFEISEREAVCLLCGIIDDSANFKNANRKTFENIAKLLGKTHLEYPLILRFIELDGDISQRIALLTACKRAEVERVGNYLIAKSIVGSFESKAAEALIVIGADFAFVGCNSKNEARISARMRGRLEKELGINLATQVMEQVGRTLKGSGGGHACAAGADGPNRDAFEEAMNECITLTKELLERKANAKARS
ncbi:MAG: DHH family phosphoesterase [Candidatus Micrarchaeota archaeon]|nr:DHH family phosphoesterase [Candidatus Micrarchaeota archaeon]